ncbi:MAG: hypothetical protein WBX11_14375, partial [Thiobacillaceae bacterium]
MLNRILGILGITAVALLSANAASAKSDDGQLDEQVVIVTASNATNNQLLVYDSTGALLNTIPTNGQGGVGGNAGGIAHRYSLLAVVNFASGSVSVFDEDLKHLSFKLAQVVPAMSNPVSVAFGNDHLYILSTTKVESHPITHDSVSKSP